MLCKQCGSNQMIKYGTRNGRQQWRCKFCGRHCIGEKKEEPKEKPVVYDYSLGYVIGTLVGDGSLSKWRDYHYFNEKWKEVPKAQATRILPRYRYSFQLKVVDKDFTCAFAEHLLKTTGRKPCLYSFKMKPVTSIAGNILKKPYSTTLFKVQLVSKEWYEKLNPLKKDLVWLKETNFEVKMGFLRGLFDSEGSVEPSRFTITLTNKNVELLTLIRNILFQLEIDSSIYTGRNSSIHTERTISRLAIYGRKNAKKFHEQIGFYIERKMKKIEEMIGLN